MFRVKPDKSLDELAARDSWLIPAVLLVLVSSIGSIKVYREHKTADTLEKLEAEKQALGDVNEYWSGWINNETPDPAGATSPTTGVAELEIIDRDEYELDARIRFYPPYAGRGAQLENPAWQTVLAKREQTFGGFEHRFVAIVPEPHAHNEPAEFILIGGEMSMKGHWRSRRNIQKAGRLSLRLSEGPRNGT
jgi:hypothetical protein